MGFRFRKSINIIPGVRINLSNGAPSLSVGPRGASLSFGKRGTYANLGLPGTGLSYRTRIDRTVRERQNSRTQSNPGLREALEQEVERLMTAITAITNIHEFSPSPVDGNTWASLESHYLQLHQRTFDRPVPVRPSKPEYSPLPSAPDERYGRGFLGDGSKPMRLALNDRMRTSDSGNWKWRTLSAKTHCLNNGMRNNV
ncbi:Uncharacterised protein (plasmid) [Raoultella terrigena]|uniref:DUF4236 domain-containing protein n=1 Tax=Raoultella terrigena TaxID=577 RepID=A0A7Z8Z4S1_RAOTE|nr:Uncharacterised protein [Raoultella terrigena]